jgi:hypothetical protein
MAGCGREIEKASDEQLAVRLQDRGANVPDDVAWVSISDVDSTRGSRQREKPLAPISASILMVVYNCRQEISSLNPEERFV